MLLNILKSKIHRATVTDANLNYPGSISIDPRLCKQANLKQWEKVEIFNCNNGERFATYVIHGKESEICLNGAAARKVQQGDIVIIVAYCHLTPEEADIHQPIIVLVDENNKIK